MVRRASRLLLALAVPVALAGCFVVRRGAPAPAKNGARDSSVRVITGPDSVAAAARRDSVAKANAIAAKADSAKADSAATDSSAAARKLGNPRADSSGKKIPRKPVPKATRECILDFTESPPETRLRYVRLPDSTSLTFIGGGFVGHCQGEKNQIRADSAEQYEASGILNLFGNVTYMEPERMRVQSDNATYFQREERLFANGNVVATQLASGSTFRGSTIEYLRPLAGARTTSRLIAQNRPSVQLIEKDSTGKPGVPITVSANTMVDEGDSLLFAWGAVQINREMLVGESDSASFDKLTERARLIRTARVINRDPDKPFRLFGDTIEMFTTDRKLDRVVARHKGNASSDDVVMLAEIIDLRFVEQELARAFAYGTGRATATTSSQELVADSIDIRMFEQRVRQVQAVGKAVATGKPDTLQIRSTDRDVLRGDTVTAWFDSTLTPGDTSKRAQVQQIHALGNASSFFLIASKQGPTAPHGVNYVRGVTIRIHFDSGQVRDVTVDSSATGLYLEPVADSLSDSTKKSGKTTVPPSRQPARPPVPPPGAGRPPESDRPFEESFLHSFAFFTPPDPRRRP